MIAVVMVVGEELVMYEGESTMFGLTLGPTHCGTPLGTCHVCVNFKAKRKSGVYMYVNRSHPHNFEMERITVV